MPWFFDNLTDFPSFCHLTCLFSCLFSYNKAKDLSTHLYFSQINIFCYKSFILPFGSVKQYLQHQLFLFWFFQFMQIINYIVFQFLLPLFFLLSVFNDVIVIFLCLFWKSWKIQGYHMLANNSFSVGMRTITLGFSWMLQIYKNIIMLLPAAADDTSDFCFALFCTVYHIIIRKIFISAPNRFIACQI